MTPFQIALQRHKSGDYQAAGRAACAAAALEPDSAVVWNLVAAAAQRGGDGTTAARTVARALIISPLSAELWLNAGVIARSAGENRPAARCFRSALALCPENASLWGWLTGAVRDIGDLRQAATVAGRTARLTLTTDDIANYATLCAEAGSHRQAAEAFARGAASAPADAHLWTQTATAGLSAGAASAIAPSVAARRAELCSGTQAPKELARARARIGRYQEILRRRPPAGAIGRGLAVRGCAEGYSGYAYMIRRFLAGFAAAGVPTDLVGVSGDEPEFPAGASRQGDPPSASCLLSFVTPSTFEPVPGVRNVLFSMFEGARISDAWARLSGGADLVIVPTASSRDAWAAAGYPVDRLRVCPLGVDAPTGVAAPLYLATGGGATSDRFSFRFLNISDLTPRKNLRGLLRVWLRATRSDDDALLILKPGKGGPAVAKALQDLVAEAEKDVGRKAAQAAPIAAITVSLDDETILRVTAGATHYLSVTHGEGWDLPMTQSGALGLELIAPRHSSYLDFLDDETAHMLPCRPTPARPRDGADAMAFFGSDWWSPDEDAAAGLVRSIIDGRSGPRRSARDRLIGSFGWPAATVRLLEILRRDGCLR
jgi:tetratricopeptide (TPR) repeat protein